MWEVSDCLRTLRRAVPQRTPAAPARSRRGGPGQGGTGLELFGHHEDPWSMSQDIYIYIQYTVYLYIYILSKAHEHLIKQKTPRKQRWLNLQVLPACKKMIAPPLTNVIPMSNVKLPP